MSTLLSRLYQLQTELPEPIDSNHWNFSDKIAQQSADFFRPLLQNLKDLQLEYDSLRVQISRCSAQDYSSGALKSQLTAALVYAELLDIFSDFSNYPHARGRLQRDQDLYRNALIHLGICFALPAKDFIDYSDFSISEQIRGYTASTNWPRLMLVRMKRVLNTLVPLAKNMQHFTRLVYCIDVVANPIFSYLAWCFYVPRLAVNSFNLLKNTLDGSNTKLLWHQRLSLEWDKLWFELCNDSVWLLVGLVNCFVLTGALAPAAIYLTVSLYIFDILLAGIRAYVEFSRLNRLSADYKNLLSQHCSEKKPDELREFSVYIEQQIAYERAKIWLSLGTTSALFFGMCFALPMVAISPLIPLFGASFIVVTCVLNYYLAGKIEAMKPKAALPISKALQQEGLFAKKLTEQEDCNKSCEQGQALAAVSSLVCEERQAIKGID